MTYRFLKCLYTLRHLGKCGAFNTDNTVVPFLGDVLSGLMQHRPGLRLIRALLII